MSKNLISLAYAGLNAIIVALAAGIGNNSVPIPKDFIWVAPILVAFLTAISPYVAFGAKEPQE